MTVAFPISTPTCLSPLTPRQRVSCQYSQVSFAKCSAALRVYQPQTYSLPFKCTSEKNNRTEVLHQLFDIPAPVKLSGHRQRSSGSIWSASASKEPFNVIITGSSKGLGLALAEEFLRAGDRVLICSRSEERVQEAVDKLSTEFGENRVVGTAVDVRKAESVAELAKFAKIHLGRVDAWINNAGSNAYTFGPLVDSDNSNLEEIVGTNTLGVMLCCRQAILLMREQEGGGGGHIFNMDGAGADGNATPRFAAYGATKRCLGQFTKSLQAELKMLQISNVTVHNLSPGMVTTELLMAGATTKQAKFFINALAEPAEQVAQFLVPRIRDVLISRGNSSTYIRFLTGPKAYAQILSRLLFKARKDKFVVEDV